MDEITLEIVGLKASSNGRACCMHQCCGAVVEEGDMIVLKKCVVLINEKLEEAIKCVRINDGAESCTIGFIPRVLIKSGKVDAMVNRFAKIIELYDKSPSTYKRRKSGIYRGMAKCIIEKNYIGVDSYE